MSSNLGPITNGRDFNFFKKVPVSRSLFSSDCDALITFTSENISLFNEGTGVIQFSFNGNTIHGELNPNTGTSNLTITNSNSISKIWFKLFSGPSSNVRIQANAVINPEVTVTFSSPAALTANQGSATTLAGAWPVEITDGTNILGTNGNPLTVNGTITSNIQFANSAAEDAFGRLRISNPFTIFENKQLFDNRAIVWDQKLTSGGTSTFSSNRASSSLAVTSTNGSQVIRQTKQRFNYQSGKSLLIMCTFVMGSTASGIIKKVGYFDNNNGIFLQQSGSVTSFVVRSNVSGSPTDIVFDQSNWNIDKLNGTGISGINLDITKAQILFIDLEWLGTGRIRYGFVINGTIYYVHEVLNANNISSVYMSTPNLPIRYEINNVSSSSSSSLEQICSTVISEGGFENKGFVYSADRGVAPLTGINNAALYPLISIKIDNTKIGAMVMPEGINTICSTNAAIYKWALILNPTIAGVDAAAWVSVPNSCVQYDISRTISNTLTGGSILHTGYANQVIALNIDIPGGLGLGIDLNNVSDQIVLAVQKIDSATDAFLGAITWREYT